MRPVHWLFLISTALFVSGIAFLVASARIAQQGPDVQSAVEAPVMMPVATVKQIMQGIVAPAATAVFGSVSTIVTTSGREDRAPKTEEEWQAVGSSAAALVEGGNLLMMGNRAVDRGEWLKMSQALIDGGLLALKAIDAKDADALSSAGEPINLSCDNCHQKYQRGGS
jgi:hypothetical protein